MLTLLIHLACTKDLASLALTDVNATSSTYQQQRSLLDYEGVVSVWYFGHAT